jgi:hypothetical protein
MSDRVDRPYLFRFRRECLSPSRSIAVEINHRQFIYDSSLSQLVVREKDSFVAVVDSPQTRMPSSKKEDCEKGEDQKDRWMWK